MTPGFRHEFRNLTPADVLTVLGWLLDPAQDSPCPGLPDDMLDALQPLHRAYCEQHSELSFIVSGED